MTKEKPVKFIIIEQMDEGSHVTKFSSKKELEDYLKRLWLTNKQELYEITRRIKPQVVVPESKVAQQ